MKEFFLNERKRGRERFEFKSGKFMNGTKWVSATPCTGACSLGVSREGSTRKFTADGAAHSSISALRSNDGTTTAHQRCRWSFLRYHRSSLATHVTHETEFRQTVPTMTPESSVIGKRFLPAPLSQTVLHHIDCFCSSSTRRRIELSGGRNDFARKPLRDTFLFVMCAVQIFFSLRFRICVRNIFYRPDP